MGIRDKIQTKVSAAFDSKLADAVTSFAATRTTVSDEYDAATGTYPESVTTYAGRGVFGSFSRQVIDQQHILSSDIKLTALQSETLLDSNGSPATPAVNDTIDGMDVIEVRQDPAGAIWSIQLRGTRAVADAWILSAGVWSDIGIWDDSEVWIDG